MVDAPLLAYYRYLNAHGKGTASTIFLFVVAILDAGRNSLSFFLLLVVSLGLSVVRDDLGRTMRKAQILSISHFIFGGEFYIPRGARSQLIGHCSVVRCGHRGARIRVNIGSSITALRSATGIHIERVPYVDPLVSQW